MVAAFQRSRFRWLDLLVLAAAASMVVVAPISVREAAWVDHLEPLPKLALAGLVIGYLLARTRLSGFLALILLSLLGVELVAYTYSSVAPAGPRSDQVDFLAHRLSGWFVTVMTGGVSNDALVFALAMALLAWLLGVLTAWLLFRDNAPWLAVTASGLALLINLSYASSGAVGELTWFLVSACLVLAAHQLSLRHELWRRAALRIEPRVGLWVIVGTSAAAGVLLSVGWALPGSGSSELVGSSWTRATAPWESVERVFDRLFASLNGSDRTLHGLNFGRTLAPRGSFDLGEAPVLAVHGPPGLYMRATTADRYTGQAMSGTEAQTTDEEANADLLPQDQLPGDRAVTQATVTVLASRSDVAFAPDAPLRLSVPSALDTRGTPEDVAAIRLGAPLQHDEQYDLASLVSQASIQDLRAAGEDYPDWVRDRYLQVPPQLPRRVVDLAHDATSGATSAFDKAAAVEQYLRTDYTYSTHVPEVPPDRDWVDFFLFDSRQGYCDYFATTMTMLLRTEGVPARVASGFAPGTYDPAAGTATVHENDAHSWVEVYFPRYGWQTFEPSSIRPIPARLDVPDPVPSTETSPVPADSQTQRLTAAERAELQGLVDANQAALAVPFYRTPLGLLAIGLGTLLVLVLIALLVLILLWQRGMRRLPPYQRPYAQLLRLARWSGRFAPEHGSTPSETAEAIARRAPGSAGVIRTLTSVYVEGTYGGRAPTVDPWPGWAAARRGLARSLFRQRFGRPPR
ncbi:MAG: transglutaminase domain-containing protein [Chloroflexi bacterium]|nr:transglutaminase domain-containing protein [Chloroflexota bacterium]